MKTCGGSGGKHFIIIILFAQVEPSLFVCLLGVKRQALSAQIGYIAP